MILRVLKPTKKQRRKKAEGVSQQIKIRKEKQKSEEKVVDTDKDNENETNTNNTKKPNQKQIKNLTNSMKT